MEGEKVSRLVEENMKTIFAYALSRISPREDAEDLAGDIILAILQSAPRIRDENAFFGYIWSIAANTYKKFLHRRNRVRLEELEEEYPSQEDFTAEILNASEYNMLRRELALLSGEYRECTIAYYFDGLSCGEIASKLHISLEMVKYYLFKTRKIMKEGISMEREFGQKSYQPAKFEFNVIFAGEMNREYHNLFNRKLPGNILVSAYYTPMTIRELAVELGVAAVYLEDEIALLEKYHLLSSLPGGKYQSRLVILTEDYMDEVYRRAEKEITTDVGEIILSVRNRLQEWRSFGFCGSDMKDERLIWAVLYELIRNGWGAFKAALGEQFREDELYRGGRGTCYGVSYEAQDNEYGTNSFAGYAEINGRYAASYADFHILPRKNWYTMHADKIRENIGEVLAGDRKPDIPIISAQQKKELGTIFRKEIAAFGRLHEFLYQSAGRVMREHAPQSVAPMVDKVAANTLLFHSVGFLGACAVTSGALAIPDIDGPLTALIYEVS